MATHTPTVSVATVPQASEIARHLTGASFHDCYAVPLHAHDMAASAAELTVRVFSRVPRWVERLMRLRNRLAAWVGLKGQGSFAQGVDAAKPAHAYQVGDRMGFFTVMHVSDEEFIIGDMDLHLTVRVSVCKVQRGERPELFLSTVVHERNWMGRAYMFFVGPAHKIIAPATLRHGYLRGQGGRVN